MAQTKINASQVDISAEDIGAATVVSTMPTAGAGYLDKIIQYIGATDASYTNGYFYKCVSDGQDPATYSWTRVDVQPAPVIPDPLPSQTGQSGKFLTTDGTDASWSDKPLVNKAPTPNDQLAIKGSVANTAYYGMAIGNAYVQSGASRGIAIGHEAFVTVNAIRAVQIGSGANGNANTVKISNINGNYEIMSADGTIPADRLTHAINKYSTMPTAASTNEGWIVQFTGTTDSTYTHGYIYECKAQGTDPETYAWEAVEVQASSGGGSSYTAGTGIDITSGVISVTDPVVKNWSSSSTGALVLQTELTQSTSSVGTYSTAVGAGSGTQATGSVSTALGYSCRAYSDKSIAIGNGQMASAVGAIQIGAGVGNGTYVSATNSDANTFKVSNENGNFEIMSADGSIPVGRLSNAVAHYSTLPAVSLALNNTIAQYVGATDASYTNGYFYKCSATSSPAATISQTVGSGLSDLAVVLATYQTQIDPTVDSTKSFAYITDGDHWFDTNTGIFVDLSSWGISYSGTPNDNDQITVVYSVNVTGSWTQVDVQPSSGGGSITPATVTLAAASWSSNTQTVNVTGVTSSNSILLDAAPASQFDYVTNGVKCTAQGTGTLTFTCTNTPTNAITVNVLVLG